MVYDPRSLLLALCDPDAVLFALACVGFVALAHWDHDRRNRLTHDERRAEDQEIRGDDFW